MLRKDLFMRKTNKKLSKLVDDKSGVILVTVIFIVAMALVFITTALTISIANRQRVYSNAQSDQARLTVTSLAQAIWQAIYSQQINDQMLYQLAKGNGSLVTFKTADVPGMSNGGTVTTAYFYLIQDEDRSRNQSRKIGIECKCEIDGVAQYYTMVLQKNQGESTPSPGFNITCDLGEGGTFSQCCIGFDIAAARMRGLNYRTQVAYDKPDNIVFLHSGTLNTEGDFGFYSTLLCSTVVHFREAVFARDVYFLGSDAGLDIHNQNHGAQTRLDGSAQNANMYFWGTSNPIRYNGGLSGTGAWTLNGISNIYFDRATTRTAVQDADGREPDEEGWVPTYSYAVTGFEGMSSNPTTFSVQNFQSLPASATLHYEYGITGFTNSSGRTFVEEGASAYGSDGSVVNADALFDPVEANGIIENYVDVDPTMTDTIAEVRDDYLPNYANAKTVTSLSGSVSKPASPYTAYLIKTSTDLGGVSFNITDGEIIIFCDGNIDINFSSIATISGSGDASVTFILMNGAEIHLIGDQTNGAGIVDTRCYRAGTTNYLDLLNLDQTQRPRCFIYSLYTGGKPLSFDNNNKTVVNAYVGFYSSGASVGGGNYIPTQGHGQQGVISINCMNDQVYLYGRVAAGNIERRNGGNYFYMPYCPELPSSLTDRGYAYRDATDYSVVSGESGYFTTTA